MDIESIQNICRQLPAVTEDIKWEHDLVFSIGGKMFCVVGLDQLPVTASFKVTDETFDEMSQRPGYSPAPYMARHKWVLVEDIRTMSKTAWKQCIRQSYDLVKAKLPLKLKKQLGIS